LWAYPTYAPTTSYIPIFSTGMTTSGIGTGNEIRIAQTVAGNGLLSMLLPNAASTADVAASAGFALPLNTWSHLALVRSGNTTVLYYNGVSNASITSAFTFTNAGSIRLGANPFVSDGYFSGFIGGVRIVNGRALYTGTFTPPTSAFPFVEGTSLLMNMFSNAPLLDAANNAAFTFANSAAWSTMMPLGGTSNSVALATIGTGTTLSQTNYPTGSNGTVASSINLNPSGALVIGGNVTVGGGLSVQTQGSVFIPGSAMSGTGFIASSATANAATAFGSNNFTIEVWAYPTYTQQSGYTAFMSVGDTVTGDEIRIFQGVGSGTNMGFLIPTTVGPNYYANSSPLSTVCTVNAWTHVALVRNGSTMTMYSNGTSVSTATVAFTLPNAGKIRIGTTAYPGSDPYFTGFIGGLRILKGTALYTSSFTPPTTNFTNIPGTSLLMNMFSNTPLLDSVGGTQFVASNSAAWSTMMPLGGASGAVTLATLGAGATLYQTSVPYNQNGGVTNTTNISANAGYWNKIIGPAGTGSIFQLDPFGGAWVQAGGANNITFMANNGGAFRFSNTSTGVFPALLSSNSVLTIGTADTSSYATGGTITSNVINGVTYFTHAFTTTGTTVFRITAPTGLIVTSLLVGGGGAGGNNQGGGGGAGAVIVTKQSVAAGDYNVVVGAGGAIQTSAYGLNGVASTFNGISAVGGGGGGAVGAPTGVSGGCGGGGGFGSAGGSGTVGGDGGASYSDTGDRWHGGGGGGMGYNGFAASANTPGGGAYGTTRIVNGIYYTLAGGGGGQLYLNNAPAGGAGRNGGGTGAVTTTNGTNIAATAATPNTGGGGGGGNNTSGTATAGGSGVVYLSYPVPSTGAVNANTVSAVDGYYLNGAPQPMQFTLPDTEALGGYIFLGTWTTLTDAGRKLRMMISSSVGYNALVSQQQSTELFLANAGTSPYLAAAASYDSTLGGGGNMNGPSVFKIVSSNQVQWSIYALFGGYTGQGSFYTVNVAAGDSWSNVSTIYGKFGSTAPTGTYVVTATPIATASVWSSFPAGGNSISGIGASYGGTAIATSTTVNPYCVLTWSTNSGSGNIRTAVNATDFGIPGAGDTQIYTTRNLRLQTDPGYAVIVSNLIGSYGNGSTASISPLAAVNGNPSGGGVRSQIEFQYFSGGGYKHYISSRHTGGTANDATNALDFWLYSAAGGDGNSSSAPGTSNVRTMSVTAGGVGVFQAAPAYQLDVTGTIRATAGLVFGVQAV